MTLVRHGMFAALTVLAIATQAARIRGDAWTPQWPSPADGLVALGFTPAPTSIPGVLTATAPGCDRAVEVFQINFDGLGAADARQSRATPAVPRFVYLGGVAGRMDAASIAGRWLVAGVLRAIGLRTEHVPRTVEVAMLPAECPALRNLKWSKLSPWR